jgi:pimeloyl-ACP methyl ester carboxylesterase
VAELADVLQLDRFAVLGLSGGGPYAAACAYKIPKRLTATAVVCGMGPAAAPGSQDGFGWMLLRKPSVIRRVTLMLMSMGLRKSPDKVQAQMNGSFTGPDKALLQDEPELVKKVISSMQEAFRAGTAGVHHEAGLYQRPWGFRLQDIAAEVHLWHGEQDNNVLVSVGHYVADAIPDCRAKFIENEGHFTLPHKHIRDILGLLVA